MRLNHIVALALILALASTGFAGVVVVPGDQPTIQAAVTAAADGDTIIVKGGKHAENVVIDGRNNLTIIGKGGALIDPGGTGVGLVISNSTGISVSRIGIRNTGSYGIQVTDSTDVTVSRTVIGQTGDHGIRADGCEKLTISPGSRPWFGSSSAGRIVASMVTVPVP